MAELPLEALERALEELARKWERFFARDREVPVPPERERAALERQLKLISRTEGLPTAVRFRLETLLHRFSTYNQLWERQLRARTEAMRQADAARAASVKREDEVARLHREYLASLEQAGRPAQVDLQSFRRALEAQKRKLEQQGLEVQGFVVVKEGGKVSLRARARKKEGA